MEYGKVRIGWRGSVSAACTMASLLFSFETSAQAPSSALATDDASQKNTVRLQHITDAKGKAAVVADITRSIKGINTAAKVLTCDHVVRYRDSAIAGKDSSFAAVCTFDFGGLNSRSYTAAVCDDIMIGKFTFGGGGNGSNMESDQDFINYIALNCPPGG